MFNLITFVQIRFLFESFEASHVQNDHVAHAHGPSSPFGFVGPSAQVSLNEQ